MWIPLLIDHDDGVSFMNRPDKENYLTVKSSAINMHSNRGLNLLNEFNKLCYQMKFSC